MHFFTAQPRKSPVVWTFLAALIALTALPRLAAAEALLLVEADSGKVLQAENATYPWHPASVTKIMTAYVTLKAVKEGKLTLDTLLTVSPTAAAQSPSKMGFRPGTQLTVDNALKMMMVKSANDMAVVLAEGVGGSIDGFSEQMNATAQRLGMTQTHYVNPNGLPAEEQVTSARDLAILARAMIRDLPEYEYFVHIPAIRFGKRVTHNFNKLIGRYPGADGFKTGFICASGYNLVASATRNGRRLIAVVLGANSGQDRAVKAAQLLERGFSANTLAWLTPSLGTVDNLAPIDATPPNLRDEMCGPKRKRPASDEDEQVASVIANGETALSMFSPPVLRPVDMIAAAPAPTEPVIVYTGPTRTGAALIATAAQDADQQTAESHKKKTVAKKKGPKSKDDAKEAVATEKSNGRTSVTIDTSAKPKAKSAAKPSAAKPAAPRHAAAKSDAAKPDAADKPTTAKPKPKPAAKPAANAASDSKPAKPGT
ncbi:D-alanyl-D-alanine carboxypeptidase family protein [Rhodopseudomonas palustris]|uniref:D-alanyl-D-alanine carboxypeptidase n=1 Tax=Rhodopseudomonas palustris TaxID=1076 RepID=A0A418VNZ6_RHOPL|nr:D-alanyl-D-alanine carboxypeptidase family protein [Rhodopseudomonas palustris]RJF77916.1 D-alanyl-D-alanine carboxypeptidase [Rhodopseudomonas palustris]